MDSIVKTENKKNTTFVKTRGWESCWYKLEGGDGGARSGHGAVLLGQEVLTFSFVSFSFVFPLLTLFLCFHESYPKSRISCGISELLFLCTVITFFANSGLPCWRAEGGGKDCAEYCETSVLLSRRYVIFWSLVDLCLSSSPLRR